MALSMVHLLVAREWAHDKPRLYECPEFYFGAIAPDAMHVRFGGDKSHKNEFHLDNWTSPDYDAVYAYWNERFSPFDIGYGLHVLTDAMWVPRYHRLFPELIKERGYAIPELYYNDVEQTDFELIEKYPGSKRVLELLAEAEAPNDHPLLTAEELNAWRTHIFEFYAEGCRYDKPVRFITYGYMLEFFEYVLPILNDVTRRYFK